MMSLVILVNHTIQKKTNLKSLNTALFYFLLKCLMKPSEKKPCKFCWENMNFTALKCNHCWEFQDPKYKWRWVVVKPWLFQKVFCTSCHHTTKWKTITKWSLLLEIVLWCLMIIPWLIYSGYRAKSKYCVCSNCKSDQINLV